MNIAYVGNFKPSHSTENHLASTLESMGHHVFRFQEDGNRAGGIMESLGSLDIHLFLYTRTWGFIDGTEAGNRLLEDLAEVGIPTASYHLDLYLGLKRADGDGHIPPMSEDPFWRTKYVFTPDGAPSSAEEFRRRGINHFYIKPGVYGPECYISRQVERYQHDVVFVGSQGGPGFYHDEWPYRKELVDWLRATYGTRFGKYGYPQETVRGAALNELYASARVVVGDSLCLGFDHPYYWSDRVYETLGRGGFLIHPWIEGLEDEFGNGRHLVLYQYGDFDQLRWAIDEYVNDYLAREKIRLAGHEFVKNNCTYAHRLREALEILAANEPIIKEALSEREVTHG